MNGTKKSPKGKLNGTPGKFVKAGKRKANVLNEPNKNGKPISEEERQVKKIKLKKDLNKIASVDELNQLQATEKLYHSNFFHLQIEELLKEAKLKEKHQAFVDKWLPSLQKFIMSIEPDSEKINASELPWLKSKKVVPPFSEEIPWVKSQYFFQFLAPKAVNSIGSLQTSTVIGFAPVLDVCLVMPPEFFQKGNHLNGIYHQKRALYLSYVALKLSEWDQVEECQFSYAAGDPLRPIVVVKPSEKHGKHIKFQIHAVCGEESFKLERFLPDKSNVKQLLQAGGKKPIDQSLAKNEVHTATPHYNSSILRDLTAVFNDEFLVNSIGGNSNIQSAIVLLKIWLRQRGLDAGYGGFSGYILSMFTIYLLQKGSINLSMNSYQIVRQVWIAFGKSCILSIDDKY